MLVLRDALPWGDAMYVATSSGSRYVRVRDLERDGEPEALGDRYPGGRALLLSRFGLAVGRAPGPLLGDELRLR